MAGVPLPGEEARTPEESPKEAVAGEESETSSRQARAPWHFKVVAAGSVVYLGYRLYQGISWLAHHI